VVQVNANNELRIVGSCTPGLHVFSWTTSNQSLLSPPACLLSAGAYLRIPTRCLSAGATYVLSLGVDLGSELGLSKQVSQTLAEIRRRATTNMILGVFVAPPF
jgi:hypothetical protein